jgi:leucyl-tRNA synthetase
MQQLKMMVVLWHTIISIRREIIVLAVITGLIAPFIAHAVWTHYELKEPIEYTAETAQAAEVIEEVKEVEIVVAVDWTKERIDQEIEAAALKHGVSAEVMRKVVKCESGYKINARGDGGHSRGLVQIHSTYHPTVTDEMADDPAFALEFLAEKLSQGKGSLWTCWRMLR